MKDSRRPLGPAETSWILQQKILGVLPISDKLPSQPTTVEKPKKRRTKKVQAD